MKGNKRIHNEEEKIQGLRHRDGKRTEEHEESYDDGHKSKGVYVFLSKHKSEGVCLRDHCEQLLFLSLCLSDR